MKNTMTDLRNHLFELMEKLKDDDEKVDLDRAKLVISAAQTLVDTAKVEVQFLEAIDSSEATEFFDMQRIEERRSLNGGPQPEQRLRRLAS